METSPVDPGLLDLGTLAFIVGGAFNDDVAERLRAAGYPEVKQTFGYVVQHLVAGPRSATELARLLGISQQAATKRLQEMRACGLLDEVPGADARRRDVALSARGRDMLAAARRLREAAARDLLRGVAPEDAEAARRVLLHAAARLGIDGAIRRRQVHEPR